MQNKFWIALIIILLIALVGVYMASVGTKELGTSLGELVKRAETTEKEVQILSQKVPPYTIVGEAVSYVIEFENGAKFYFGGDSGLTADMKVIGDFYKPDAAFLGIGNIYSMDPKSAAYAAYLVNPTKYIIPNHYASFPMLVQDTNEFFAEVAKYGLRAKPLKFEVGVEQEAMGIKVLWLGHSAWLFETPEGTKILVDPAIQYNPSYPEAYKDLTKFGRIDLILITHGHFDHLDVSDLKKWIKLYDPIIEAVFETGVWLKEVLPYDKIIAVNKGSNIGKTEMLGMGMPAEKIGRMANIKIYMVPSAHTSGATPEGMLPRL
jgi:L-ascorbate metabolism protein UlaG (beta-lactamase superfamily)